MLSKHTDTIIDFSITEGDAIESPNNLNLRLIQRGDHLLLKDLDNKFKTTLVNTNSDDLFTHQHDLIGSDRPNPCLTCTHSCPVAQKTRDNSWTSPSDHSIQQGSEWQQRPLGPVLISGIHTSSSHHAPHQCSDSAEKWIRPGSTHPLWRRTAPLATLIVESVTCLDLAAAIQTRESIRH